MKPGLLGALEVRSRLVKVRDLMAVGVNSADKSPQQISIDLFGSQSTITEIRIHGYVYDPNIKAASCVVALDVVCL